MKKFVISSVVVFVRVFRAVVFFIPYSYASPFVRRCLLSSVFVTSSSQLLLLNLPDTDIDVLSFLIDTV